MSMMEKLRNAFLSGKDFCEDTAENFRETVTAAMDAANRNAEEILSALSREYHRVRQAMITQEITEVTSGARAMKKKGLQK